MGDFPLKFADSGIKYRGYEYIKKHISHICCFIL